MSADTPTAAAPAASYPGPPPPDEERRDPAHSPGAALRSAREASGRTVEQLSAATCIRATVIRDLEGDRHASSGDIVYVRGHVKAIAAAAGADPAPILALLDAPEPAETARSPRRRSSDSLRVPRAARPERSGPNWLLSAVAAVVMLLAGLYAVGRLSPGPPEDAVLTEQAQAGQESLPSPPPGPAPATVPPAPAPPRAPAAASLAPGSLAQVPATTGAALRVRAIRGSSWINVSNAAGTVFEGNLRQGEVRDFTDAKLLRLLIGNAGALNLVCSNKDLEPAGDPGAVRRYACTRQGFAAF